MSKWIRNIMCAVIFIACILLIIVGQRNIGPAGLGVMLIGLVGLILLLIYYNKRHK